MGPERQVRRLQRLYLWRYRLTASYKGFALDLRYSGTDLSNVGCSSFYMATNHACAGNVIATLTYNFTLL